MILSTWSAIARDGFDFGSDFATCATGELMYAPFASGHAAFGDTYCGVALPPVSTSCLSMFSCRYCFVTAAACGRFQSQIACSFSDLSFVSSAVKSVVESVNVWSSTMFSRLPFAAYSLTFFVPSVGYAPLSCSSATLVRPFLCRNAAML
jgi:hypothetical protein